jgi:hypothetical protein
MQITSPTQTKLHPDEETTVLFSTVWLREGGHTSLEIALFNVDEYSGETEFGDPVFMYSHRADDDAVPPRDAMDMIQNLAHSIVVSAFKAAHGTLEERAQEAFDAYHKAAFGY